MQLFDAFAVVSGNRTRVFSLGSFFYTRTGVLLRLVRGRTGYREFLSDMRFWYDWHTDTVRRWYGIGSVEFGVQTGYDGTATLWACRSSVLKIRTVWVRVPLGTQCLRW